MRFSSPTLTPNYRKTRRQTMRKITMALLTVLFTLLPLAGAYGQAAQPSFAITPPPLPDDLAPVPAGNKLFLGTHSVAPRTTSASPQGLASPTYSSRRRPPCPAKTVGKLSPTTSPPTRLSLTLIQRWWPLVARFAPRGSTGTPAASGLRCTQLSQTARRERSPSTRRRSPGSCSIGLDPRTDRPVATS